MENRKRPAPGEFFKHFKGKLYQIITVAIHSETGEEMVVYQALYGDYKTYVRPLAMFMSEVDKGKYPDVEQKYRFERVTLEAPDPMQPSSSITRSIEPITGIQNGNGKATLVQDTVVTMAETSDTKQTDDDEEQADPRLMEFLDAKTYEEKLRILVSLKNKVDRKLLDAMAAALDLIGEAETLEEQYDMIKSNLMMQERFECNRLR